MATNSEQLTDAQELAALRTSHAEVLAKSSTRKDRIAALEAEVSDLKAQLLNQNIAHEAASAKTDAFIRRHFVDGVAEEIATELSIAPHLLLPYILPRLTFDTTNGEPATRIVDAEGKPSKLSLADFKAEIAGNKDFAHIIVGSRATGAGGGTGGTTKVETSFNKPDKVKPVKDKIHFGLK